MDAPRETEPRAHPDRRRSRGQRRAAAGAARVVGLRHRDARPTARRRSQKVEAIAARPDPARRHDAEDRRHRGRAAGEGQRDAAVHSDHHADGARLDREQGRGARGGRRRLHHQADRLRRAQGAASTRCCASSGCRRSSRSASASCSRPTSGCDTCRRPTRSRDSTTGATSRSGSRRCSSTRKRLNEPFSCVMCDLDRFKSVNDTYGHQAGDAVLKQFAQILQRRGARDRPRRAGTAARSSCCCCRARCSTPR